MVSDNWHKIGHPVYTITELLLWQMRFCLFQKAHAMMSMSPDADMQIPFYQSH